MVLPLLFALGAQFLAANAGATLLGSTALAAGAAAAGGNALGQLAQNGRVKWGDAALAGIGGGISSAVGPGAAAAKGASLGNMGAAAGANAAEAAGIGAPSLWSGSHMMDTAKTIGSGYFGSGLPGNLGMIAMMASNTPAKMKAQPGSKEEQERLKALWGKEMELAKTHEADFNSKWYNGGSPYDWFRSKGFEDGGVNMSGIALPVEAQAAASPQKQEIAKNQTQELFDIAILVLSGKLSKEEAEQAMNLINQSLGPEQAQAFLEAVADMLNGYKKEKGGRVVDGQPSANDNVMAKDANTGQPIKLASGEAILPAPMVEAAGGGIAGANNIVNAAARGLPQIQPHAMDFARQAHM